MVINGVMVSSKMSWFEKMTELLLESEDKFIATIGSDEFKKLGDWLTLSTLLFVSLISV